MAYTTIDDPSAHFQIKTFTGNNTDSTAYTFDGNSSMQPDLLWFKSRSATGHHDLIDSTRGVNTWIGSNDTSGEVTNPSDGYLESFDSDGWTTANGSSETNPAKNNNGGSTTYVTWGWKANGGTTSSNTSGDITSTVQVNSTAGFSIGTYTGDGDNTSSVGHGLGAIPAFVILKSRTGTHSWIVWHQNLTATTAYAIDLDNSDAEANNASYFHDTAPDANTFHPGDGGASNGDGTATLFYAWKEVQGFSKFGTYTGNGSTDGVFVYTGFKPAFVIIRATDSDQWRMYDHKRANPYNVINVRLNAHLINAESQDDNECDFLSNGIKWRSNSGGVNTDGQKYIYMAFAEQPFVTSGGVPCTAR
jgi:hypothetical protein